MAAVKAHSELISGVEHFDKAKMKHTETTEKNPLPEMEGLLLFFFAYFDFVWHSFSCSHRRNLLNK